jgi:hypothetical protein
VSRERNAIQKLLDRIVVEAQERKVAFSVRGHLTAPDSDGDFWRLGIDFGSKTPIRHLFVWRDGMGGFGICDPKVAVPPGMLVENEDAVLGALWP